MTSFWLTPVSYLRNLIFLVTIVKAEMEIQLFLGKSAYNWAQMLDASVLRQYVEVVIEWTDKFNTKLSPDNKELMLISTACLSS